MRNVLSQFFNHDVPYDLDLPRRMAYAVTNLSDMLRKGCSSACYADAPNSLL